MNSMIMGFNSAFFHISFYSRAVGKKQNKIAYNKIYKIKFQG